MNRKRKRSIDLNNDHLNFDAFCKSNELLGSALQFQDPFPLRIKNDIFISLLNFPICLVNIIESYCNAYHYIVNIEDEKVQRPRNEKLIMPEICNLFLEFLKIYWHPSMYCEGGQKRLILEISPDVPDFCLAGVCMYRMVVQKTEVKELLQINGWKHWEGETRHGICTSCWKRKPKNQLHEIIETGGGIGTVLLKLPSNPFLRLMEILEAFFQAMKRRKSNFHVSFCVQ